MISKMKNSKFKAWVKDIAKNEADENFQVWITYGMINHETIQFPIHKAYTTQDKATQHIKECGDCNTFQAIDLE